MSLGFPTDKANLDGRVGSVAMSVRDSLEDAHKIKAFLDTQTDAQLVALGYDEANKSEVTHLRSVYGALDKLYRIAHGQDTQTPASDFFFDAHYVLGLN